MIEFIEPETYLLKLTIKVLLYWIQFDDASGVFYSRPKSDFVNVKRLYFPFLALRRPFIILPSPFSSYYLRAYVSDCENFFDTVFACMTLLNYCTREAWGIMDFLLSLHIYDIAYFDLLTPIFTLPLRNVQE